MPTVKDVATWMMSYLERKGILYQDFAVSYIRKTFGKSFVYTNKNGNPAIATDVLEDFRELYQGKAIWDKFIKRWELLKKQPNLQNNESEEKGKHPMNDVNDSNRINWDDFFKPISRTR